jgi:short-subunit dehydrogenase
MSEMLQKWGPTTLITGAASERGLGAAYARHLADLGFDLVLVDVDGEGLAARKAELAHRSKVEVRTVAIDLGREDCAEAIDAEIDGLEIGLLVCNHLLSKHGHFSKISKADHLLAFHVNARGYLLLTHYFGSKMVERGRGGILIVSSGAALAPEPFNQHYSAYKAYQLALAESLWGEWRDRGVDVIAVLPPVMATSFDASDLPQWLVGEPHDVAVESMRKLGKKSRVAVGWGNKLIVRLSSGFGNREKSIIRHGKMIMKGARIEPFE